MGCAASSISETMIYDPFPFSPPRPIYRQAVGRDAKLGDLYDATTDNFFKETVFQRPLPPDSPAISRTDNRYSDSRFSNVSSLEDKFRELKLNGELQLSILAGMCQLEGSAVAEYFKQKMDGFGTVISTQLYHIKTVTERLEVSHDHVKNNISENAMRYPGGTHVVIEIQWGANCVITAREEKYVIENKQTTKGKISLKAPFVAKIGLHADKNKRVKEEGMQTSVAIVGDVIPDELPQTVDDAKVMMANILQLVKNCNDGKGKPLTYTMIPLERLVSKRPSQSTKTFIGVNDARTKKIVRLFDHMTELRQKVPDRIGDLEDTAKEELKELLEKVRSGKEGMECLDAFCEEHRKNVDDEATQP